MVPRHLVALSSRATDGAVSKALRAIETALIEARIDASLTGRIELAMAEAMNNVVEHGYANRPAGAIHVQIDILSEAIRVRIRDMGRPVPDHLLDRGAALPDLSGSFNTLPEGGFGWFLIHDQTDEIRYQRKADENHLELLFFRDAGAKKE